MRFIGPDVAALLPVTLNDDQLMQAQRSLASAARAIESASAGVAAEIARRSSRELGYDGLAQRLGARTPERLVQVLSGGSLNDARRLVRVGTVVESSAVDEPWLSPTLELGVQSIDAIRAGLGAPTASLGVDVLGAAARRLATEATTLDVDALARRAREVRNELDVSSIALHEEELRAQRFLRLTPLPTGMTRVSGLLDPESAAVVVSAIDSITSPRRGGPRFVDADEPAVDDRTIDQLMADALVDIVAVATRAPSGKLFGKKNPAVRVLVTRNDLERREGAAYLEGQPAALSVATAERHVCTSGLVPVEFDDEGQGLNLGRTERFHVPRQRTVLAARDGGCIAPGCERPPAWTEVHHIVPWSEGGATSVEDAVLLCRFHHMMVHNNGWQVTRTGADYTFVPPVSVDPSREPIALTSKSPALRRLLAGVGRVG